MKMRSSSKMSVGTPGRLRLFLSFGLVVIMVVFVPCLRIAAANCVPPPPGLLGWWRGEGNALDSVGTNHGRFFNGATIVPGQVGQAFSITSPNQCVKIPDAPALNPTNGLSLEAWVMVSHYPANDGVIVVAKNVLNGPF